MRPSRFAEELIRKGLWPSVTADVGRLQRVSCGEMLSGGEEPHQGANRMLCTGWPQVTGNLASTRRSAEQFLDGSHGIFGALSRKNWFARWTSIGDAHCLVGRSNIENGAFEEATEAWLCALTAFEVAKRLADGADSQSADVSAKVEASIQRFGSLEPKVERIQIAYCDQAKLHAYYLPAGAPDVSAPAVICISAEEETEATLLSRLLPAVIGRRMSVLVVSHDDVSNRWRGQAELFLSCCLDYLSARPDIDATRIGIYGEGLSAGLATDFAIFDRRVAAAVCDGGLWNWARTHASVGWMTKTADVLDENVVSMRRSQLVRQLKCPVLVVAGGRGIVSVPEAIKLEADCTAARIDLELAMPRTIQTQVGEFENFIASDEYIFGWLDRKLARGSAP